MRAYRFKKTVCAHKPKFEMQREVVYMCNNPPYKTTNNSQI